MKRVCNVLFTSLCLIGMTWAVEAKTYKMGAFPIPLLIEDRNRGVFVELFQEVAKRTGESFEFEVYPAQRTKKMFTDGEIDGIFPALDKSIEGKYVESAPFYSKNEVAFVREGVPYIEDATQLEGKTVGVTKGYTYGAGITSNPKITLDYADSDVVNMRKLSKGRLDAFVVEEKSGLKALKESGVTNVVYNPEKPLSARRTFFAFQDTAEGRALAGKFTQALAEMKKDGSFEQIMRKAQ
jgi:polar amino acid transport system substrate-binding protein